MSAPVMKSVPADEDSPGASSPPPPSSSVVDAAASAPASVAAAASSSSPASAAVPSEQLLKPSKAWTALVLGASGATGRQLVRKLAANPRCEKISAIVRKEVPLETFGQLLPAQAEKIQQVIVDFDHLKDKHGDAFKGFTVGFSCLGSTRAKAGSKEEFKRLDYGYNLTAALLAKAGGVRHYNLMSTAGANDASLFHYLRVKGELERDIHKEAAFPSFAAFRPNVLLTDRPGESRLGEKIAQTVLPWLHAILPEKNCAVHVETVAEAMMIHSEFILAKNEADEDGAAIEASVGAAKMRIFENDEIRALNMAKL